jgi:hypothetical protein
MEKLKSMESGCVRDSDSKLQNHSFKLCADTEGKIVVRYVRRFFSISHVCMALGLFLLAEYYQVY